MTSSASQTSAAVHPSTSRSAITGALARREAVDANADQLAPLASGQLVVGQVERPRREGDRAAARAVELSRRGAGRVECDFAVRTHERLARQRRPAPTPAAAGEALSDRERGASTRSGVVAEAHRRGLV